jgi:hypothetical protein
MVAAAAFPGVGIFSVLGVLAMAIGLALLGCDLEGWADHEVLNPRPLDA